MNISSDEQEQLRPLPQVLVGVVLLLFGLGFIWFLYEPGRGMHVSSWGETTGIVVSNGILRQHPYEGDNVTTYGPQVVYEYEVEGRSYTSDRVYLNLNASAVTNDRELAQSIADSYPVRSTVTVWYDQNSPDIAVLVREVRREFNDFSMRIFAYSFIGFIMLTGLIYLIRGTWGLSRIAAGISDPADDQ